MNLLCNGQTLEYSSILGHGHQSVNRDIYVYIYTNYVWIPGDFHGMQWITIIQWDIMGT